MSQKPVLVDADEDFGTRETDDHEELFGDLIDVYLDGPAEDHIYLYNSQTQTYPTPRAIFQAGLTTKGQWLLSLASEFYADLQNGGLAQFLANKPGWQEDVTEMLSELGLDEFHTGYRAILEKLEPVSGLLGVPGDRDGDAFTNSLASRHEAILAAMHHYGIDEPFRNKWWGEENEGNRTDSSWSQQFLKAIVDYCRLHPEEFKRMQ